MTRIDQIIADSLAGSPETHVAILAREVVRLREAQAVVVPESLLHDLAMAAWDEGADAGMVWDPDADPAKRGVVPCTPEEGIAKARDHFARHGSGSPGSAFSRALQAIRENSRAIRTNHGGAAT